MLKLKDVIIVAVAFVVVVAELGLTMKPHV